MHASILFVISPSRRLSFSSHRKRKDSESKTIVEIVAASPPPSGSVSSPNSEEESNKENKSELKRKRSSTSERSDSSRRDEKPAREGRKREATDEVERPAKRARRVIVDDDDEPETCVEVEGKTEPEPVVLRDEKMAATVKVEAAAVVASESKVEAGRCDGEKPVEVVSKRRSGRKTSGLKAIK